jgi:NADPH-dependent glutamate synthase beta subunit-like oxidoreductase
LHALSLNDPKKAWEIMMASHPLRGVLGRVCYGFCETPCNRGEFDKAISIQMLEAVIGDHGFDPAWRPVMAPRNGMKILVVGAGPAGLTAAWFLNIAGYRVDLLEASEKAGGVLRYGIPSYRLDRDTLDQEVKLIADSGVRIKTNTAVKAADLPALMEREKYGACVIAIGAGARRPSGMEGENKTVGGLEMLKKVNTEKSHKKIYKGKDVIVIGGGNVAMDACRSAIRLGAKSVKVLYRRTEDQMPAHAFEVREARQEGVEFAFLLAPEKFDGTHLTVRKMVSGKPDKTGRIGVSASDETESFRADEVIMAIGQEPSRFEISGGKNIHYAGDVIPESEGTVIHAVAAGKRAAQAIHVQLTGDPLFPELAVEVPYAEMNIDRYFQPRMRLRSPKVPAAIRKKNFESTDPIVTLEEGIAESMRCFRCGICIGGVNSDCDWCFRACGDKGGMEKFMVAWNTAGPLFERVNDCDACGKCWEDCPRAVVTPVEIEDME